MREVLKIYQEETEDKTLWEFWLHKVFDKTFGDFMSEIDRNKTDINEEIPTEKELITTIRESNNIINGFCPT